MLDPVEVDALLATQGGHVIFSQPDGSHIHTVVGIEPWQTVGFARHVLSLAWPYSLGRLGAGALQIYTDAACTNPIHPRSRMGIWGAAPWTFYVGWSSLRLA